MEALNKTRIAELILAKLVNYDKDTGDFTWKESGEKAGGIDTHGGYYQLSSLGTKVYGHRLAMVIMGKHNVYQVDHDDRNRSNNKWENLIPAEEGDNHKNHPLRISNKSGQVGVDKVIRKGVWNGKWTASITVNYKKISLGTYAEFDDAVEARKFAERHYGFHKNHGS